MGRQQDNPATPSVKESEIIVLPIILGGVGEAARKGNVYLYRGVADYFGVSEAAITAAQSAGGMKLQTRTFTSKKTFKGIWDQTGADSTKGAGTKKFFTPPSLDADVAGKTIIVPTERTYTRTVNQKTVTYTRVTSIKVPTGAILAVISDWIHTNFVTHRPAWFKTESGHKYAVISKGSITDLNPGNEATAAS
jgi:hypothetical protein